MTLLVPLRSLGWVPCLGLLAGACEAEPAERPAAALFCEDPEVDFGTVFEGAILEHEFELTVGGDAPLTVAGIDSDCGCTVAELARVAPDGTRATYVDGTSIEPGTRLAIGVRYDTRGKRGPTVRNLRVKDGTGKGATSLTLRADVRAWFVGEPAELELARLLQGETDRRSLRVRSVGGERFLLTASRRGVPDALGIALRAEDPDELGRASAWQVELELGAELPRGAHTYPIELVSDVENPSAPPDERGERPRFSFSPALHVEVLGPVSLSPSGIVFGLVDASETVVRTVRLECHDPSFRLAEPHVRLEPVKPGEAFPLERTATVRTRPIEGANAWEIEVLLAGLDEDVVGTFLARLVIETGHPELARLEAPVSGVRRPGRGGRGRRTSLSPRGRFPRQRLHCSAFAMRRSAS